MAQSLDFIVVGLCARNVFIICRDKAFSRLGYYTAPYKYVAYMHL
jgi:hypothetical protein